MVKNTTGGNKSKSFASKSTNTSANHKLMLATDDDELYVCVTKLLGNGRFITIDNSGKEYMAILRNKMKGRNKRNYLVSLFSLLLVRLQGFTEESNAVEISAVYSDSDIHILTKKNDININNLIYFHNNKIFYDQSKQKIENADRYEFDMNGGESSIGTDNKLISDNNNSQSHNDIIDFDFI